MRLSCNFVNVNTIAYRVQYTWTRVHAHIPNGHPHKDPREKNCTCRTSRRGSSRACPAHGERSYSCGKLNREVARHADILATILARKSARMSVSVTAPWNFILTPVVSEHCAAHTPLRVRRAVKITDERDRQKETRRTPNGRNEQDVGRDR